MGTGDMIHFMDEDLFVHYLSSNPFNFLVIIFYYVYSLCNLKSPLEHELTELKHYRWIVIVK